MTIGLTLSGCVGHKAIRICLPDADSEIEFEGPSSISGVSTGKIELKGRGSYLSIPMYHGRGQATTHAGLSGRPGRLPVYGHQNRYPRRNDLPPSLHHE